MKETEDIEKLTEALSRDQGIQCHLSSRMSGLKDTFLSSGFKTNYLYESSEAPPSAHNQQAFGSISDIQPFTPSTPFQFNQETFPYY